MSPVEGNKKLVALLKRLRSRFEGAVSSEPGSSDSADRDADVDTLVYSMLLWESTSTQAKAAWKRLNEHFIDYNDLRAALPDEIVGVIGDKYPRAAERALRIRSALNDLYRRFHGVTCGPVRAMGKREQRSLFDSIEGLTSFAAARTLLLRFDVHAIPVDERLRELLISEGGTDQDSDLSTIGHILERQVDAESAKQFCAIFESWSDADGGAVRKERKSPAKAPKPAPRTFSQKTKPAPSKKKISKSKSGG